VECQSDKRKDTDGKTVFILREEKLEVEMDETLHFSSGI
jgi:hypothetical protein